MSVQNILCIGTLNKDNHDTCKIQIKVLLIKNVNVSEENELPVLVQGDEGSKKAVEAWKKANSKAKSDILSISPSELKQIKNCNTSREVYLKLEGIYQSQVPARKATLLKQLTLQHMEEGANIREHLRKFSDAVDKLGDIDVEINADLLAMMLLYSLPSSFENFKLPTPESLRVKIVEEYDDAARVLFIKRKIYYLRKLQQEERGKSRE